MNVPMASAINYMRYLFFHDRSVQGFLSMNNLFTDKKYVLLSKTATSLLYATITLSLSIYPAQRAFAASPHNLFGKTEQPAHVFNPSASNNQCRQHKKLTAHFLNNSTNNSTTSTCWETTDTQIAYVNDARRFYAGYRKQAQQRSVHLHERIDQ